MEAVVIHMGFFAKLEGRKHVLSIILLKFCLQIIKLKLKDCTTYKSEVEYGWNCVSCCFRKSRLLLILQSYTG